MSPWEALLLLMSWLFVALCVLGAAIIVFAVLVGAVRGIRKWFAPKPGMSREQFDREKRAIADNMHASDQLPLQPRDAFSAGALWAWGALHRRKP